MTSFPWASVDSLITYRNFYQALCSHENLHAAFLNARKGKAQKDYVASFEKNLENNLYALQWELLTHTYAPRPLTTFTVRDPKTRKISASDFRDRVVHHAVCNIIGPIFESRLICDTYANRKGKGTLAALNRFHCFLRKVATNGKPTIRARESISGFALKCDVWHYFETVDQGTLLSILGRRIKDDELLGLIKIILENHKTETPGKGIVKSPKRFGELSAKPKPAGRRGMPLGNLTSQFLANVYLGELDNFVKHNLKAKHYLRYVDDFVILEGRKEPLGQYKAAIECFIKQQLKLELHPEKSKIIPLQRGVALLGFRIFPKYLLLKKSNQLRIWKRLRHFREQLERGETTKEHVLRSLAGWNGYAKMANTHNLRKRIWKDANSMLKP